MLFIHHLYLLLGGLVILALAVYVVTIAGLKRDKCLIDRGQNLEGIKLGSEFRLGLIIAAVCGILSAMLAVGFDNTVQIGLIAEAQGAIPRNTALARWVVVLIGAYIMNAGYALILLIKNRSFSSLCMKGIASVVKWAIISGLLWFAALGTYGQGVALMGEIGTMICWPNDAWIIFDCEQHCCMVCWRVERYEETISGSAFWCCTNYYSYNFNVLRINLKGRLI